MNFTSVIIQDLQQWNEDIQRILWIHGHAEFFFIFVSLFCLLQKKKIYVGKERSPHQPNDNNITQNKGSNFIHHSIIYCEERDKIQKKPSSTSDDLSETIDSELFINKSHVILHALQKLQYIYKFQWDFPLSLLLSLSTILIIIHYSLQHWCNAMGKRAPKIDCWIKTFRDKGLGSGLTDNDNKDNSCRSQGDHALDRVSQEF